MFMLDHWESLEANEHYHTETLRVAKDLAFEMCSQIFERMGLSAIADDTALRIAGRGLTFVIPLRDNHVPMKYANRRGTPRKGITRSGKRKTAGLPKEDEPAVMAGGLLDGSNKED
jgi:hypothetical protein